MLCLTTKNNNNNDRVEKEGYATLEALGATKLLRVDTAGGGAVNPVWTAMRQRLLSVPTGTISLSCCFYLHYSIGVQSQHQSGPRVLLYTAGSHKVAREHIILWLTTRSDKLAHLLSHSATQFLFGEYHSCAAWVSPGRPVLRHALRFTRIGSTRAGGLPINDRRKA